jgi:hypothetical protein
MNKKFSFSLLLLISVFCFWGCKTKAVLVETPIDEISEESEQVEEPEYSYMFPSDVLYVIGREYEEILDSTSTKSQTVKVKEILSQKHIPSFPEYMEQRLIELYPNRTFQGMLSDFNMQVASAQTYGNSKLSLPKNNELIFIDNSSGARTEPFYEFKSIEDEIEFLNMDENETKKYLALNKLATAEKFAEIEDIKKVSDMDSIPPNLTEEDRSFLLEENIFLSSVLIGTGGAYAFYRVKQSKERAVYLARKYYQDNISCGKKGDAFKHLSISMFLKRYLSESISYLVMDVYWENQGNNSPCDTYMDLHNNFVGRRSQYDKFRGNDRYDWKKWADNIHNFVENESNSIKKEWNKELIEYVILKDTYNADKRKYIFWNRTSDCYFEILTEE